MSTQTITVTGSAYYYMGLMNIFSLLNKRAVIIEGIFGEYFPDLKTSWTSPWNDVIAPILTTFGLSKMINNAMPDKPDTQGDGSLTPWTTNKSHADIAAMYYALDDAGVTFNPLQPIDATLDLLQSDPQAYQTRALRCNSILSSYETIHEIETTIWMINFSIGPLYRSDDTLTRSPGQLLTIAGDVYNSPYLWDTLGEGSVNVMWESIDSIMTTLFSKTYIDRNVFEYDMPIVTHNETTKTGTIAYASGAGTYDIDVTVAGEVPITYINLKLEGLVAAAPATFQLQIEPGELTPTTITLQEAVLTPFDDPSDVDYTVILNYYEV